MVIKQGNIIKIEFSPQKGHEQAGYRPAVVISNDEYIKRTNMAIVCPITNTDNGFPLHIPLDARTTTTGAVECEHIRTLDINARSFRYVEDIPEELLTNIIDVVFAEIERLTEKTVDAEENEDKEEKQLSEKN